MGFLVGLAVSNVEWNYISPVSWAGWIAIATVFIFFCCWAQVRGFSADGERCERVFKTWGSNRVPSSSSQSWRPQRHRSRTTTKFSSV